MENQESQLFILIGKLQAEVGVLQAKVDELVVQLNKIDTKFEEIDKRNSENGVLSSTLGSDEIENIFQWMEQYDNIMTVLLSSLEKRKVLPEEIRRINRKADD